VLKVGRKNVCKACASEELQDAIKQSKSDKQNITITQQTTQQTHIEDRDRKPRGSLFWLVFWLIVFFPIGLIYLLMRRW
tara:strand:- start:1229 stop:1465 length:237 start_codon:yes stop_codon:yes gene_type:complete